MAKISAAITRRARALAAGVAEISRDIRAWARRWRQPVLVLLLLVLLLIAASFLILIAWGAEGFQIVICWGAAAWHWVCRNIIEEHERARNLALTLAVLVGFVLALWRNLTADKQVRISNKQVEIANAQTRTSERGLNNERYQKGAEMLGSATLATRIGGVYALERLAGERPEDYHIQIVNLLCTFIRYPTEYDQPETEAANRKAVKKPCPPAVEVAAQVLGERSKRQIEIERREGFWLDLTGANLARANLYGTDLSGANLFGADLSDAGLFRADLSGAYLFDTDLSGTDLSDTNLSDVSLSGVDLTGATLDEVNNLTQERFDDAFIWEGSDPPTLERAVDAETGKPLVWRGKVRPRSDPESSET